MRIEVIPIIPWPESAEAKQTVDICTVKDKLEGEAEGEQCSMHRVLVTGVPLSIHRYLDRTWAKLKLDRVALLRMNCASSAMAR